MNWFQVKSFIKYQLKAKYAKGYGLHSPFVFTLVRDVMYSKYSYYAFSQIVQLRKQLAGSKEVLDIVDYGAGSRKLGLSQRRVSSLVRQSSIRPKYGELLYRLIDYFKPGSILELGTSIGVSTAYLALNDTQRQVITIEGCEAAAKVARKNLDQLGCVNVQQITGQFVDVLPKIVAEQERMDLVFFDGHHQKQATLNYFNMCLSKVSNSSIFIFDDIHWSKGMEEAWEIICAHPKVSVSMDLFQLGIVFFRKECQKQHFIVRY